MKIVLRIVVAGQNDSRHVVDCLLTRLLLSSDSDNAASSTAWIHCLDLLAHLLRDHQPDDDAQGTSCHSTSVG